MSVENGQPNPPPGRGLHGWLEDRIGVDAIWQSLFARKIPFGVNWFYTLGFAAMALFLVQALTGAILAMYYSASPDHSYDSIQYIMNELPYGAVIRGIHHWAASAMIAVVILHLLVVFVMGAYKYPREMTWALGVFLLLVTFGFGFTGYLLPWDEKSYWATTVGTNMAGTIPVLGGTLVRVLRGGAELGALTLTRFYAAHVLLLPMAIVALIAIHVFLVIRQGVSVPPGLWDNWVRSHKTPPAPAPAEPAGIRHAAYHEIYDRFKSLGRPFFPDLIVEDAVVAVLVTLVVLALAVLAGVPLESQADPTNTAYVPRPEWYFMFLFELLKYFPGAVEWIGAILLPVLFIVLLFALPFFDRRPWHSPRYRPIAMAAGAVVCLAVVGLTILAFQTTPPSVAPESATRLTAAQVAGRQLVEAQNCSSCHIVGGKGGNVGPSLDGIGSRRDPAYIHSYVENPKALNPAAKMPAFIPPLTHEQVEGITQYLLTLR